MELKDIVFAWTEGSPKDNSFRVYGVTREKKMYLINKDEVYAQKHR